MSLAPKIDEIRCCVLDWKPDVACFTETWLHESINDNHIDIPEYSFISKNRTTGIHGGVGLYIKNSIKFRLLAHLQVNNMEVLWVWLRPKRLPRGVPCVIIGTIYHPPNADDSEMLDYLSTTLTIIEGQYPGCGIFLAGDFNRPNVNRLSTQFKMKQLVRSSTRGDRILDLILTNLHQLYDRNSVQILLPFGLSDHNVVLLHPKVRSPKDGPSRKVITKRDTRTSRKLELGRYLNSIKWFTVDSLVNCEDKLELMKNLIHNGLNYIMPIQRKKVHVNDCPWITPKFKELIRQRQNVFSYGDTERFRKFRNLVNRERKVLRKTFFTSKVSQLKQAKPSQWWSAVKRISGMSPSSGSQDLISQLNTQDLADLPAHDIANKTNEAFLEPMQPFRRLRRPPITDEVPSEFVSESYVLNELRRLSSNKASGSDGIPNWLLKEYADILSHPITSILNSSFAEQRLLAPWKNADVIPVPKEKPVNDIKNVKLSTVCYSDWGSVPSGVPQGTKLGPWLFLLMINDLRVPNVPTWKYVDDTSIAETVPKQTLSNAQAAVTSVEVWSRENHMQLHPRKCKELIVYFSRDKRVSDPITIDGLCIPVVSKAKVLCLTISNNLSWNDHVKETIKKANKRLYFLVRASLNGQVSH